MTTPLANSSTRGPNKAAGNGAKRNNDFLMHFPEMESFASPPHLGFLNQRSNEGVVDALSSSDEEDVEPVNNDDPGVGSQSRSRKKVNERFKQLLSAGRPKVNPNPASESAQQGSGNIIQKLRFTADNVANKDAKSNLNQRINVKELQLNDENIQKVRLNDLLRNSINLEAINVKQTKVANVNAATLFSNNENEGSNGNENGNIGLKKIGGTDEFIIYQLNKKHVRIIHKRTVKALIIEPKFLDSISENGAKDKFELLGFVMIPDTQVHEITGEGNNGLSFYISMFYQVGIVAILKINFLPTPIKEFKVIEIMNINFSRFTNDTEFQNYINETPLPFLEQMNFSVASSLVTSSMDQYQFPYQEAKLVIICKNQQLNDDSSPKAKSDPYLNPICPCLVALHLQNLFDEDALGVFENDPSCDSRFGIAPRKFDDAGMALEYVPTEVLRSWIGIGLENDQNTSLPQIQLSCVPLNDANIQNQSNSQIILFNAYADTLSIVKIPNNKPLAQATNELLKFIKSPLESKNAKFLQINESLSLISNIEPNKSAIFSFDHSGNLQVDAIIEHEREMNVIPLPSLFFRQKIIGMAFHEIDAKEIKLFYFPLSLKQNIMSGLMACAFEFKKPPSELSFADFSNSSVGNQGALGCFAFDPTGVWMYNINLSSALEAQMHQPAAESVLDDPLFVDDSNGNQNVNIDSSNQKQMLSDSFINNLASYNFGTGYPTQMNMLSNPRPHELSLADSHSNMGFLAGQTMIESQHQSKHVSDNTIDNTHMLEDIVHALNDLKASVSQLQAQSSSISKDIVSDIKGKGSKGLEKHVKNDFQQIFSHSLLPALNAGIIEIGQQINSKLDTAFQLKTADNTSMQKLNQEAIDNIDTLALKLAGMDDRIEKLTSVVEQLARQFENHSFNQSQYHQPPVPFLPRSSSTHGQNIMPTYQANNQISSPGFRPSPFPGQPHPSHSMPRHQMQGPSPMQTVLPDQPTFRRMESIHSIGSSVGGPILQLQRHTSGSVGVTSHPIIDAVRNFVRQGDYQAAFSTMFDENDPKNISALLKNILRAMSQQKTLDTQNIRKIDPQLALKVLHFLSEEFRYDAAKFDAEKDSPSLSEEELDVKLQFIQKTAINLNKNDINIGLYISNVSKNLLSNIQSYFQKISSAVQLSNALLDSYKMTAMLLGSLQN